MPSLNLYPGLLPSSKKSIVSPFLFATTSMSYSILQITACTVLTQYAPAFHGFYRATISSSFPWSVPEWSSLTSHLSTLFTPEVVDHLNNLFPEALRAFADDDAEAHFLRVFLARYVLHDRPLSGYFLVCCIMETIWTVLAQTFAFPILPGFESAPRVDGEAAAANRAWARLMRRPVVEMDVSGITGEYLGQAVRQALRCYIDLLVQIEDMDTDPSLDTYAWETMSESLVNGQICHILITANELPETRVGVLYCITRT